MKKFWGVLGTLIILGLLIWLLKDINFYEVYLLITSANLFWFLLAFVSSGMTFIVWNFRCIYVFKKYIKVDFWFYLQVLFAGAFFNTVTPGAGVGGEPFRAYYLAKKYKRSNSKILGYVLGDSFFRLAALVFFIIFSVLFILIYLQISSSLKLVLELILIFIFVSIVIFSFFLLKKFDFKLGAVFRKLHYFKWFRNRFETADDLVSFINKKIQNSSGAFRKVVKNKNNLFVGLSLSFLFWIFNFLTAYFLFLSFGKSVNFLFVVIVFTLGNLVGSLSPVPGGVGVVEGTMTLLYSAMGIMTSLALLVAFLHRIIYYFFSLFVGGWCLINLRRIVNGKKSFFNKVY